MIRKERRNGVDGLAGPVLCWARIPDNQHKAILRILNEIHAACMRGKAQEVAGPLLRQLVSQASHHFSTEERLLESTGFSGLATHRAEHRKLAGKLGEFVARHENGDVAMYVQLLYFMRIG